jgi:uncharacterized protein YbjT (DUF2867 family)
MRILVLGGYGLIGLAVARTLLAAGHSVTGLGRSAANGRRLAPQLRWVEADIASLQGSREWKPLLQDVDIVVNAAGALQDGLRDDVERIHHGAIASLAAACAETRRTRLIQISAPGARLDSSTAFMRSKARGDEAIRQSGIDWIILRPGLVIGRDAYGGSALLRAMAGFPVVLPIALGAKRIQAVALTDVARVVQEAVDGAIPSRADLDVVEDEPHSLRNIVERLRAWMGVRPAAAFVSVPTWMAHLVAKIADLLGYLGWRSPMRSTAVLALEAEVLGDPGPLRKIRGAGLQSLDKLLDEIPASTQERWFARAYLLMPAMVATLSAFWIASGVIGALDVERSARAIPPGALPQGLPSVLVVAGTALDVALGIAILFRPLARLACFGMAVTAALYLVAGSIVAPGLWLDPLGPLVKIVPAMALASVTAALLEER